MARQRRKAFLNAGPRRIINLDGTWEVAEGSLDCKVSFLGREIHSFDLVVPKKGADYQVIAELEPGGDVVRRKAGF